MRAARYLKHEETLMDQNTRQGTVREGMHVKDSDGKKLGNVDAVQGNSFVVKKGFFFPNDYTIPTTAVGSVDEDTVYLDGHRARRTRSGGHLGEHCRDGLGGHGLDHIHRGGR